jgi:HK97 family phage major capsid protein
MDKLFRAMLLRLPFMAALIVAVAAMPLNVFAYNQRGLGHAHGEPWHQRAAASVRVAAASLWTAMCQAIESPQFWRVGLASTALLLAAAGILGADASLGGAFIAGTTIDDLLKQKREKIAAANEIRNRVDNEQAGEWRGDDEKKFDELLADSEKLSGQIDRLAKLDAAERSLAVAEEPQGRRSAPTQPQGPGRVSRFGRPTAEERALAIHGWFAAGSDEGEEILTQRHREAAQKCGISLDQKKLRLRLAPNALDARALDVRGNINQDAVAAWEKRLTQVDVVSPDLGGHYTVPDEMMRPLEVALLQFGGMRQVATIIRTATGAELPNPTLNDTSNTGALLGEGLEHTELDTEFNTLILNSYKYTSRRVPVSVEYLQDNAIDFVGRIGSILGERIGRITNAHFTTGTGNSQPKGIVVAATSSGVTAAATTISYDNIIDLKHSVDPAYRSQGARFMFNDTTLKLLKKLKVPQFSGDTAGMPLWRAGMAAGEPDTIDGDPYTINQSMANPTTTQKSMLYGLLSKYLIRDVRDVTLVRLDERYAELGVVAFLAFSRHDGDLLDAGTNPVKYLTMG